MLTLPELMYRLRDVEEVRLLELLGISSQDIVDRFQDYIEDSFDTLLTEIEELDYDIFE